MVRHNRVPYEEGDRARDANTKDTPSVSIVEEELTSHTPARQQFQATKQEVELQGSVLKKELRLVDLIGIQILGIVAYTWIGTAGKLGSSHVLFWWPAVVLFYIPWHSGSPPCEGNAAGGWYVPVGPPSRSLRTTRRQGSQNGPFFHCHRHACAYLVMFAIPLFPRGENPSWKMRVAAICGFLMTLLFVLLSVFPIVDEQNPALGQNS